ncbi:16377_t:CDS:2 [Funneliformis caledonium]|uniref:16377_t:CDS:1 n=1 Tax=Funneliformis caledonium TaxID=1117310 RepID=A0A9N9GBW5_9GLOM|nr:16377_t:CDS:2 [Funneliformis caledonium]
MLYQNGFLRTIPSNMFNATEVFAYTIHNAKIYGHIFGYRCLATFKPPMR